MRRPARLLGALLLGMCAWAQAISYTVQVVAVSDQGSALALVRQLLLEQFPAYAVRTTTGEGDVYRVRVGAFANRPAAVLYAEAMPQLAGGPPLPALAESIPAGVMPLEPRLVMGSLGTDVELLAWESGGLAWRVRPVPEGPYVYHLAVGGETVSFEAWRAAPAGDGSVLRLHSLPLWPDSWEGDPEEVRESHLRSMLGFVAAQFELPPEGLERAVLRPEGGPPALLVVQRLDPARPAGAVLVGLAFREDGTDPAAGALELVGAVEELPEAPVVYRANATSEPAQEEFRGDGWVAREDGEFLLLDLDGTDRGWRAAVGLPLWTDGEYLLARAGEQLLLYDFVRR